MAVTWSRLPEEPWGRKMERAREDLAGLTLTEAADLLTFLGVSTGKSTLARLEARPVVPQERMARVRALAAVLAYGLDPTDFGLSVDELPSGFDIRRFRAALKANKWRKSGCLTADSALATSLVTAA